MFFFCGTLLGWFGHIYSRCTWHNSQLFIEFTRKTLVKFVTLINLLPFYLVNVKIKPVFISFKFEFFPLSSKQVCHCQIKTLQKIGYLNEIKTYWNDEGRLAKQWKKTRQTLLHDNSFTLTNSAKTINCYFRFSNLHVMLWCWY